MKKRKALIPLSLLALAMVGLAACAGTSSSSSSSSSEPASSSAASSSAASSSSSSSSSSAASSSSQVTVTSITISNAEALQAEWHVGGDDRSMTIVTDPAINIQSALNSGALTITSSNTSVVSVAGRMLSPVGVGEATITVAYGDVKTTLDLVVYTSAYILPSDDVVVVGGTVSFGLAANTSTLTPSSLTWTSSDTTIATVSEAGVVTGVKAGSVTITGTVDGDYPIYSSYTLTVAESAVTYTNCGDIKAAGTYTSRGKVVASYSSGFFFDDGTGVGWTYKSSHGLSVGDYVKVSGSVTQYHNLYEFGSSSTITPIIDTTIVPQEEKEGYAITELTPSNAEATLVKATTSTKVKWTSIAGLAGTYTTLNLAGYGGVAIETVSNDLSSSIETGKVYEIEGYFAGYSSSSGGYCQICITKLTEVTPTTAIVQLESYSATAYLPETSEEEVTQVTVDVDFYSPNSSTPTVASDAEAVATATYADGTVTITPVASGTANVTVTVDGVSQTIAVTVKQSLSVSQLSSITATGTYRIQALVAGYANGGYFLYDGTGTILLYNSTIKNSGELKVGKVYDFTATVGAYRNRFQVTAAEYEEISGSKLALPTATAFTADLVDSYYTSAAPSDTYGGNSPILGTYYTATLQCTTGESNYPIFKMLGADRELKALQYTRTTSERLGLTEDGWFDVTFFVGGIDSDYLGIFVIGATATTAPVGGDIAVSAAASSINVGETTTVSVTTDSGAKTSYTYASSDTSVATVGTDGTVTGVAAGTATITVTNAEGYSATVDVKVVDPSSNVMSAEFAIAATSFTADASDSTVATYSSGIATFTLNKGTGNALRLTDSDHLRVYQGTSFTIAISSGTISGVVVTCESSSYASALAGSTWTDGVTVTSSDTVATATVSGSLSSVSFSTSAQVRLNTITIEYVPAE